MRAPAERPSTPRWVWWTLLVGAAILLVWAWFILGFLSEPSAVGRPRTALALVGGSSIGTAAIGVIASLGLLNRQRWAWRLAVVSSVFMILMGVGAIAGIPALIGLVWSRYSPGASLGPKGRNPE